MFSSRGRGFSSQGRTPASPTANRALNSGHQRVKVITLSYWVHIKLFYHIASCDVMWSAGGGAVNQLLHTDPRQHCVGNWTLQRSTWGQLQAHNLNFWKTTVFGCYLWKTWHHFSVSCVVFLLSTMILYLDVKPCSINQSILYVSEL